MPHHVASKHLQTTTELTMIIPVKPGLIDAMDTLTYATRLRVLMNGLNGLRISSREKSEFKPISDAVERIQTILSFRLSLLDNDNRLLLAVAFDGPWEPYIRKVWYDLGPLLDIIMCNCENYPISVESTFERYAAWIRRYQVESNFFYTASNLSAADFYYLREVERIQRETPDAIQRDQLATGLFIATPEQQAQQVCKVRPDQLLHQGLKALSILDGFRELYPDGTDEGGYLLRAAHELLRELKRFNTGKLPADIRAQFEPQLLWFEQASQMRLRPKLHPDSIHSADIQGGIVDKYPDIKYGALLLFRIVDRDKTREFLDALPIATAAGNHHRGIYYNLALTANGLKQLDIANSDLNKFPPEFLQGMEARAGILGDVRMNHPQNWMLPKRNWPAAHSIDSAPNTDTHSQQPVPLSTIDFMVQLRTGKPCKKDGHRIIGNPSHPLFKAIETMANTAGIELLSVEALASYEQGHFGFVDGISQPVIESLDSPSSWSDKVAVGDILLGYQNDSDYQTAQQAVVDPLLNNGTFLVVRKIQQNVNAFNEFLQQQQATLAQHGMDTEDLKGLMLGRKPDGTPLVPHQGNNDFNYDSDVDGSRCPLQSHIRRSNPRTPALGKPDNKLPVPRILRRGLSYGPPVNNTHDSTADGDRGLFFMAYNASIAKQFEVIQSWITGANASNTYSGLTDPFLGVPKQGEKRTFRCLSPKNTVLRFDLDNSDADKRPLTELQWGAYLFVPSLSALKLITRCDALQPHSTLQTGNTWIDKLQGLENLHGPQVAAAAWKTALEDSSAAVAGVTTAIWDAIREHHGALRTPYGILVGREDLVAAVMADDKTFSVSGYAERMKKSLGSIYLGMDSGEQYHAASTVTNAAIGQISEQEGFDLARSFAISKLAYLKQLSGAKGPITISLRWLADQVLAELSQYWFDLPDGDFIKAGGKPAPGQKSLHCPYHFTAPSRYIFSPNPTEFAAGLGEDQGSRLRAATIEFVGAMRRRKKRIKGTISKPMFDQIGNNEHLAQNLIGAMMGFLPTAMGLFLKSMYLWMSDHQLERLQQDFQRHITSVSYQNCKQWVMPQLMITMQKVPVPSMIWRTTTRPCTLGGIDLHLAKQGVAHPDRIVIGISAVTQGKLKEGELDVNPIFGGDRSAKQHPTHACPGQPLAMGVLLGMVTALLEGETLLDAGLPLTLDIHPHPG